MRPPIMLFHNPPGRFNTPRIAGPAHRPPANPPGPAPIHDVGRLPKSEADCEPVEHDTMVTDQVVIRRIQGTCRL